MKQTIIALLIPFLFACFGNLPSCYTQQQPKAAVYVPYFYNGEVLLPDYVFTDTTVVIDAVGLNKAMAAPIEQGLQPEFGSDKDYFDLFSKYTLPINEYRTIKH